MCVQTIMLGQNVEVKILSSRPHEEDIPLSAKSVSEIGKKTSDDVLRTEMAELFPLSWNL